MLLTDKILIGTAQLGLDYGVNNKAGKPSSDQSIKTLTAAYALGFRSLDTAEAYGNSHQIIGKYQQSNPEFQIVTKLDPSYIFSTAPAFEIHIKDILTTLNASRLDGFLFHNFQQYQSFPFWQSLKTLKEEGLIDKAGVSIYSNEQARYVADQENVDLVQMPFNLLDNLNLREEVMQLLYLSGKSIHIRSVFLQGLFFKPIDQLSARFKGLKLALSKIREISSATCIPMNELALGYALSNKYVDKVIIGIDSIDQLNENNKAIGNLAKSQSHIFEEINDYIHVAEIDLLNPSNW